MLAYQADAMREMQATMSEVIIYRTQDGHAKVSVNLSDETVWLTQRQLAYLFEKNTRTISEHIKNIFKPARINKEVI